MIEKAALYEPYINWTAVEAERDILLACGRVFFERVMNGLEDLGVDVKHPGQIFAALKAIGEEIIENLLETESKVVVISTYNGIALSFAQALTEALKDNGMEDVVVIMGGLLNENRGGSQLAEDVTKEFRALGVNSDNIMENTVPTIKKIYEETDQK